MKKLFLFSLLFCLFPLTALAQVCGDPPQIARMSPMIVGGGVAAAGCTTPSNHTYDQGFEDAATPSGWTKVNNPTFGGTLSGTPPLASCSKGMLLASGTTGDYGYWDNGSGRGAFYFRIDIRATATSLVSGDDTYIFTSGTSTTYSASREFGIVFHAASGPVFQLRSVGATPAILINPMAVNTWYIITGFMDYANAVNSWIKINNGTPVENTTVPYAINSQYFFVGRMFSDNNVTFEVGYFAIDVNAEISGADVSNP